VVTIFKTATSSAPTTVLGDVEVKRGGSAVESKTNPWFKVSVPKVSPPATEPAKTSATHFTPVLGCSSGELIRAMVKVIGVFLLALPFLVVGGLVVILTDVLGKPTVKSGG
jgi:hypothetical protein